MRKKQTFARPDAVCPTYHCRSQSIHEKLDSHIRHIMINLNGEEETGNSRMEKGHWVIDIGYNCNER